MHNHNARIDIHLLETRLNGILAARTSGNDLEHLGDSKHSGNSLGRSKLILADHKYYPIDIHILLICKKTPCNDRLRAKVQKRLVRAAAHAFRFACRNYDGCYHNIFLLIDTSACYYIKSPSPMTAKISPAARKHCANAQRRQIRATADFMSFHMSILASFMRGEPSWKWENMKSGEKVIIAGSPSTQPPRTAFAAG